MTMKKILMTLAAVLCCTMTTTVFTACGSDDDNSNTSPSKSKVVGYQVDYSLEFPKEQQQKANLCGNYFLLCDKIEVGYLDENGQEQKEVVNNGKWSKSIVYKKSVKGQIKLYLTKPSNPDPESLTYEAYAGLYDFGTTEQTIKAILSDGTRTDPVFGSFEFRQVDATVTFSKAKILQYMEEKMKTEVGILNIAFTI